MFYYLKGKIALINKELVIIENCGIGYQIYLSHPSKCEINKEYTFYVYEVNKDNILYLIGFESLEEKRLFILFLKIKGVGPKTALNFLKRDNYENIIKAIYENNFIYFQNVLKFSDKFIVTLKESIHKSKDFYSINSNNNEISDAFTILSAMGFKKSKISKIINLIDCKNMKSDEIVKLALGKIKNESK